MTGLRIKTPEAFLLVGKHSQIELSEFEKRKISNSNNKLAIFWSDNQCLFHMESVVSELVRIAASFQLDWLSGNRQHSDQTIAPSNKNQRLHIDVDKTLKLASAVDRLLLEYFSLMRTTQEYWFRKTINQYGDDSAQLRELKKKLRKFKADPHFNFANEMRNYTQHHRDIGLTLRWIYPWLREVRPPAEGELADLTVDPEFLIGESHDWRGVFPWLKSQKEGISLIPILKDVLALLWEGQNLVWSFDINDLRRASNGVLEAARLVNALEDWQAALCVFKSLDLKIDETDFQQLKDNPEAYFRSGKGRHFSDFQQSFLESFTILHVGFARVVTEQLKGIKQYVPSHKRR